MSVNERDQGYGSDEAQLDEAVRKLAKRLAPNEGKSELKAPRSSRPSAFLFLFLLAIALLPSVALALIGLGNADIQQSLWAESRRASAAVSAFTAFLGTQESSRPKSQTEAASVSPTVETPSHDEIDSNAVSERELDDPPRNDIEQMAKDEAPALLRTDEGQPASVLQKSVDSEPVAQTDSKAADGTPSPPLQDVAGEVMPASPGAEDTVGQHFTYALQGSSDSEMSTLSESMDTSDEESSPAPQSQGNTTIQLSPDPEQPDPEQDGSSGAGTDPTQGLVLRPEEIGRVQSLMSHGHKMLEVGYFAGARAYFRRAAEAGSGAAALALGATYDPHFIEELGAHGIKPEPAQARAWYERAKALGADEAQAKLADLDRLESVDDAATQTPSQIKPPPTAPSLNSDRQGVDVKEQSRPKPVTIVSLGDGLPLEVWAEPYGAVNMREAPLPTGEPMRIVRKGTKLRVRDSKGSWLQVTDPETGEMGWIYSKAVEITESASPQRP